MAQENVWDYPRPPALEKTSKRLKVVVDGKEIANTTEGYRVLETSHPPTYYIPPRDVAKGVLEKAAGRSSFCEWKGSATYWNVKGGVKQKVWSYEQPTGKFGPIAGYLSFYAHPPFRCFVGEEEAQQQPGDFYGGWKTSDIIGEMKGAPGTMHW
ncbi:hypothetical protein WJX84_006093 [Apatococcus fuscideae]|uniref:DUF427 domain-containing protein n=1 Tax=Apatococcus fuscideae TaxID=2026836 RepID=A0AAW1TAV1_9CHLO